MSVIGRRELIATTDPGELAKRAACATEGHRPATYNVLHDATWCRCGALVVEGHQAPFPAPRSCVHSELDDRARRISCQEPPTVVTEHGEHPWYCAAHVPGPGWAR